MSWIERTKQFISKYERHLSSSALIGGFIFDIVVLDRIDMPTENLWIVGHLLIALVGILILNFYENRKVNENHYWLVVTIQFAFGGLLSTFLVFYFRSAALSASWPFLALLFVAFAFNELLKEKYTRLTFQISYFYLSTFSFLIYYLPIVFERIGSEVFILSGLSSLLVVLIFLLLLSFVSGEEFEKSKRSLRFSISGIFIIFNVLYFTNIIPPIPLSLKDAGVYYSVSRNLDGNYVVKSEKNSTDTYFSLFESFKNVPGHLVYVYSAVFSPTRLNTDIIHEWQFYDEESSEWITKTQVKLPVLGGRGGGYRTYSASQGVFPGYWRVNVETSRGQVVGIIKFKIENVSVLPELIQETKE